MTQRVLVASRDYLHRRGAPVRPDELKTHDIIALAGLLPGHEFQFVTNAVDGRLSASPPG